MKMSISIFRLISVNESDEHIYRMTLELGRYDQPDRLLGRRSLSKLFLIFIFLKTFNIWKTDFFYFSLWTKTSVCTV